MIGALLGNGNSSSKTDLELVSESSNNDVKVVDVADNMKALTLKEAGKDSVLPGSQLKMNMTTCTGETVKFGTDTVSSFTHIEIIPPSAKNDKVEKIHFVFVVDVSGSMGTNVESKSNNGNEDHGFNILDLVKHSILTIINSLDYDTKKNKEHVITLVKFTDFADTLLEGLPMTKENKDIASTTVNALRPEVTTNIWAGLKKGYDAIKAFSETQDKNESSYRNEIMLFTDGCPNVDPPRGHIPSMQKYVEQHEIPTNRVCTFGFGYNLSSKLLEEIAIIGNGTFSFIPDAGMVGTIFIHTLADILTSTPIENVKLLITSKKALNTSYINSSLTSTPNNNVDSNSNALLSIIDEAVAVTNSSNSSSNTSSSNNDSKKEDDNEYKKELFMKHSLVGQNKDTATYKQINVNGSDAFTVEIPLGNVQIGQARHIILKNPEILYGGIAKVALRYYDCVENEMTEIELKGDSSSKSSNNSNSVNVYDYQKRSNDSRRNWLISRREVKPHFLRLEMCHLLREIYNDGLLKFGKEQNNSTNADKTVAKYNDIKEKYAAVKDLIDKFECEVTTNVEPDAEIEDEYDIVMDNNVADLAHIEYNDVPKLFLELLKDLKGQVLEALENINNYNKWGIYYLRSLNNAHLMEKRNNFKDFGVLCYGGKLFEKEIDRVNDIFDNTKPPTPSRRVIDSSTGRARAAPVSMSSYNNCYGPCFSPDSLVYMFDGTTKKCSEIKKGDLVRTGNGNMGQVKCVVKTVGDNMNLVCFDKEGEYNGLKITPWHPIYNKSANSYVFPAQLAEQELQSKNLNYTTYCEKSNVVYNFILEKSNEINHSTMIINGVTTVALGHGLSDKDFSTTGNNIVLDHPYFANYDRIVNDFQEMDGFTQGSVLLRAETCCVKDPKTGLVMKMVDDKSSINNTAFDTDINTKSIELSKSATQDIDSNMMNDFEFLDKTSSIASSTVHAPIDSPVNYKYFSNTSNYPESPIKNYMDNTLFSPTQQDQPMYYSGGKHQLSALRSIEKSTSKILEKLDSATSLYSFKSGTSAPIDSPTVNNTERDMNLIVNINEINSNKRGRFDDEQRGYDHDDAMSECECPTSPERRPFCSPLKRRTDSKEACFKDVEVIEFPPLVQVTDIDTATTGNDDDNDVNKNNLMSFSNSHSLSLANTKVRSMQNNGFHIITYQNTTPSDELEFFDREGSIKRQKTAPAECIGKLLRQFGRKMYDSDTCSTADDQDNEDSSDKDNEDSTSDKENNRQYLSNTTNSNKLSSTCSNKLNRTTSLFNRSIFSTRVNNTKLNIRTGAEKTMNKRRPKPPQTTANVVLKTRRMKTITNF